MPHRNRRIALVILEALLWLFVTRIPILSVLPDLSLFRVALNSTSVTFFQLVNLAVLALALIVGMLSRSWQGAIALNVIASAPGVLLTALALHLGTNMGIELLSLIAPLAALGWFGWLLRFARAEVRRPGLKAAPASSARKLSAAIMRASANTRTIVWGLDAPPGLA